MRHHPRRRDRRRRHRRQPALWGETHTIHDDGVGSSLAVVVVIFAITICVWV